MGTLTAFDPGKAGFRVAAPIRRKPRSPSTKPAPKPQYADAVWYSFREATPLEVSVRVSAVADTVRRLKRAARYLERTHKDEVRVQISVEAYTEDELALDAKLKGKTRVKFLGHAPFMLGRRITKARAEELAGIEANDEAAGPESAAVRDALAGTPAPKHARRTVAGTRGQHAKTALQHAVVRAVITAGEPSIPSGRGLVVFPGQIPLQSRHGTDRFAQPLYAVTWEVFHKGREAGCMEYYREYIEITDPDDGGPAYTAEIRLCHEFPQIAPNGGNQVVVFDCRVPMSADWRSEDMPTDTWAALVLS